MKENNKSKDAMDILRQTLQRSDDRGQRSEKEYNNLTHPASDL